MIKLIILVKNFGLIGYDVEKWFCELYNIEVELFDLYNILCIFIFGDRVGDVDCFVSVFIDILK